MSWVRAAGCLLASLSSADRILDTRRQKTAMANFHLSCWNSNSWRRSRLQFFPCSGAIHNWLQCKTTTKTTVLEIHSLKKKKKKTSV